MKHKEPMGTQCDYDCELFPCNECKASVKTSEPAQILRKHILGVCVKILDHASVMAMAWWLPQLTPKGDHHFEHTCIFNALNGLDCPQWEQPSFCSKIPTKSRKPFTGVVQFRTFIVLNTCLQRNKCNT